MPPSRHKCIQCHAELPVSDVSDVGSITCPGCDVEYRAEAAERGVRVYPRDEDTTITELRLRTLRDYADETGVSA